VTVNEWWGFLRAGWRDTPSSLEALLFRAGAVKPSWGYVSGHGFPAVKYSWGHVPSHGSSPSIEAERKFVSRSTISFGISM
jgi:hypothetical protein